jgi:hypothetical protein
MGESPGPPVGRGSTNIPKPILAGRPLVPTIAQTRSGWCERVQVDFKPNPCAPTPRARRRRSERDEVDRL